jgi:hypothetical protein
MLRKRDVHQLVGCRTNNMEHMAHVSRNQNCGIKTRNCTQSTIFPARAPCVKPQIVKWFKNCVCQSRRKTRGPAYIETQITL